MDALAGTTRVAQKIALTGGCGPTMAALTQQMNACLAIAPVAEQGDCTW